MVVKKKSGPNPAMFDMLLAEETEEEDGDGKSSPLTEENDILAVSAPFFIVICLSPSSKHLCYWQ